jgi:regulatory protein
VTPTVTGLRERPRGRVEVELDGAAWRVLPADAVVRAGLRTGRPLDRETARLLARELRRGKALARAARALATRDRSRGELEDRLQRAGVSATAREEAIAALEASGVLDDARVAESRAQELARRGYGNAAIRSDLARRRLPSEAASAAIDALEPERDRANSFLDAHGASPAMLRRLAARGFSRDTLEELSLGGPGEAVAVSPEPR